MDVHQVIAVATLVAAVILFISEAIPLWMTALAIPVVLAATGTLELTDQALLGFGNPAVLALAAIFVLGAGMKESGVATLMAQGLQRIGGKNEVLLILSIMVAVAVLSAFMSNAATVAVFLPAAAVLARRADLSPARLMMPLSFAAIVGGTATIIGTTPNLILAEDLRRRVGEGIGGGLTMVDFAEVGVPVTAVCILYMAFIGRRLLPSESGGDRLRRAQLPDELAEAYGLSAKLHRMRVVEASTVAGRSLREADLDGTWQLKVVLVRRPRGNRKRSVHPRADLLLEPGDELYVEGRTEDAWRFSEDATVQFGMAEADDIDRLMEQGVTLAEVTMPPRSGAIGQTFRSLKFRNQFDLSVLAIWRRDEILSSDLADATLALGDAFLVSGAGPDIRRLGRDPRFIVMTEGVQDEDVRRAPLAVGLLLLALLPPLLGWLPLAVSALGSALLMRATRCVSMAGIRECMDFRILFLIAGTIPLGLALEYHGVAAGAARGILEVEPLLGSAGVTAALFLIAATLSTTSNNGAAAVILAPVAYQVAAGSALSMTQTFLAVAFGTSCAYVLPFAHQCNLMVMGAGGYRTRDFARVGIGMSIVMAVATIFMLEVL